MPQVIHKVQVNVAVQRGDRGALRHPDLRWYHLSLDVRPDRQRLLDQLQQTAVGNPLRDQRHQLPVRDTREVRLEINLHDAPSTVIQVIPNRFGRLFGIPLRSVAVGAVVKIRLKDRLQDELHRRLHHAIFHRRNPEGSCAAFRLRNLDDPYGCELVLVLAQCLVQFAVSSPLRTLC